MKININNADLLISAGLPSQFPALRIPQIAFSGRSNVGKSSLINTMLCRKSLARVSGTPGKTVTVNFYSIDKKLMFVDLPGYGFARRSLDEKKRWSGLTDAYFTGNASIDLLCGVIQLIDAKVGATADDRQMLDYLRECGIPFVVVYTKCDKLNATDRKKLETECAVDGAECEIMFSSKNGTGREALWNAVYALCSAHEEDVK